MSESENISVMLDKEATNEDWTEICQAILDKARELGFEPIEAVIY